MKNGRIRERFNEPLYGFVCGALFGPFIGLWLYYLIAFVIYKHWYLQLSLMMPGDFLNHSFDSLRNFSEVMSISCIFNLAFFYLFIQTESEKAARGVIIATFLYIFLVVARLII